MPGGTWISGERMAEQESDPPSPKARLRAWLIRNFRQLHDTITFPSLVLHLFVNSAIRAEYGMT